MGFSKDSYGYGLHMHLIIKGEMACMAGCLSASFGLNA